MISRNIHQHVSTVTAADRQRIKCQAACVVWFTGLSGAGKSTLANALEKALHDRGRHTFVLDGDNLRHGLNKDLGFTDHDRVENVRRLAEVALLMLDAGLIVLTASISPFRRDRDLARQRVGHHRFLEVHVDASLQTCEMRDPKGLYRKARCGEISQMTGIDSPYEPPLEPALVVTEECGVDVAVASLLLLIDAQR